LLEKIHFAIIMIRLGNDSDKRHFYSSILTSQNTNKIPLYDTGSTVALCWSQAQIKEEGCWRGADTIIIKNRRMRSNGTWRRV